jgi:hypothetical protein
MVIEVVGMTIEEELVVGGGAIAEYVEVGKIKVAGPVIVV